jgi:hypothetical protein
MDGSRAGKWRARQPLEELYRELIHTWGEQLHQEGFSEEQAARLILAKLCYIRGSLRD